MSLRSPVRIKPSAEKDICAPDEVRWRKAIGLLRNRQRIGFLFLTCARISVGLCDLALAAAMYVLFMLLQGRVSAHKLWWIPETILSAAILTSILVVTRALIDVYSSRLVFDSIQSLYNDLLLRLAQGYNHMRWSRFVERNRSELSNHALNTTREAADFFHRCIELAASAVTIVVMTSALIYQSPISAFGFACALTMFYVFHRLVIRKKVQQAASSRENSLRLLHRSLADMLSAGRELRIYGNYSFFHDRTRRQAESVALSNRHAIFLPQVARIIVDQGTLLLFLCMIVAVELQQGDSRQLVSLLAFYFVLSRRLIPLVSQMSLIAGQMESSYENVKIVDSELNECHRHGVTEWFAPLPAMGLVAELRHVKFWYRQGSPILVDVNLNLRKGETIVVRGASGIGKSSLLDLIAGVLLPASGAVRVDRAGIAYVPQDIPLLDESIRNNLLFGLPERDDDDLMRALSLARLDEFVANLPLRLETGVGDNGILLSGGERQRLGLARAILRGGQLLLLDEATSAIDEENERWILETVSASGTAVILVTHRLNSYRFAHREFRLQNGYLIEEPRAGKSSRPVLAAVSPDAKPIRVQA